MTVTDAWPGYTPCLDEHPPDLYVDGVGLRLVCGDIKLPQVLNWGRLQFQVINDGDEIRITCIADVDLLRFGLDILSGPQLVYIATIDSNPNDILFAAKQVNGVVDLYAQAGCAVTFRSHP